MMNLLAYPTMISFWQGQHHLTPKPVDLTSQQEHYRGVFTNDEIAILALQEGSVSHSVVPFYKKERFRRPMLPASPQLPKLVLSLLANGHPEELKVLERLYFLHHMEVIREFAVHNDDRFRLLVALPKKDTPIPLDSIVGQRISLRRLTQLEDIWRRGRDSGES